METNQLRPSYSPLKFIVADVCVAAVTLAFVSPFLAVLLARSGVMDSDGLLHDWFYAIPAEFLALAPWDVGLVFPVSVAVYFVQYLVLFTGLLAVVHVSMRWMANRPR